MTKIGRPKRTQKAGALALACLSMVVLAASVAAAEPAASVVTDPSAVPAGVAPPAALPPPNAQPANAPGLFDAFNRWVATVNSQWSASFSNLSRSGNADTAAKGVVDAASGVAKSTANATVEAANAVGRMSLSRVVTGRERCPWAPNGAPDCRAAAETMCKGKGFKSGSSVDFQTAEECPAQALLARRQGEQVECPIENYVTRALCQ
jgi:hypothetical protein